jgi:thymidine kinase
MSIKPDSGITYQEQPYTEHGTLRLFVGPMYAGKTSKLIETYSEAIKNDQTIIVLTHSSEIRYSVDQLSTHDQKQISCFKFDKINTFIQDKQNEISESHVILIDEAQFFDDLLEIRELVDIHHKQVFVFGLDGDFKRNKFGQILDLIPYCDSVEKLNAKCNLCNSPAIFSCRIINDDQQVLIGSSESYQPMCRKCYNSK